MINDLRFPRINNRCTTNSSKAMKRHYRSLFHLIHHQVRCRSTFPEDIWQSSRNLSLTAIGFTTWRETYLSDIILDLFGDVTLCSLARRVSLSTERCVLQTQGFNFYLQVHHCRYVIVRQMKSYILWLRTFAPLTRSRMVRSPAHIFTANFEKTQLRKGRCVQLAALPQSNSFGKRGWPTKMPPLTWHNV